ncbi:hypothetical protein DCW30_03210 [Streptomyces alfalfae]|uniref:Uncharacterized protein n=1 Tax=Streptomyces alfalfae TaxID=1642299 RepID=A0A1P8TAT7_9ACTN|nr:MULTISPECIES: hypothetical protein [Streptomyces]AYA15045.1 hypothetical protein D3X13_01115 [Streptomyces fradiae]APY84734.1 hypothetical protein A7J05_02265 [Streptomyces alfalfae]KUL52958.1 hypothetical protein ADL30_21760 [Streptomyces sp. NRRL S-1521]QQC93146.1 hypothetical protein I8755_36040 [Streptomyces alfalfae]QUI35455.1 hypothetical protein H9W91_35005 [Streptomyces alfalfae]
MNDKRNHESRNDQHAETAAEEVFDEVESAETRLPDDRRDTDDGEAGDTLTPSPTAQEDIHRDTKRGKA